MRRFIDDMRTAKFSPRTITSRIEVLDRLALYLDGKPLLDATADDLRGFQSCFAHLSPATVDIYSRHVKAFYDWAYKRRHIEHNPAEEMILPRVPRGRPHPTSAEDLRLIFACTTGSLRMAYVLAAFEGLRRGEICRLHRRDLDLSSSEPTALIHGKGNKERIVPLLDPVISEIRMAPKPHGWIVTKNDAPYRPESLSADSSAHLRQLGVRTTLHSMRHTFATTAGRVTRDPMLVRDLLGHESVATTEIYMQTNLRDAHQRLAGVSEQAAQLLGGRTLLRSVGER